MVVILRYDKYIHCAQLYVVWLKCDKFVLKFTTIWRRRGQESNWGPIWICYCLMWNSVMTVVEFYVVRQVNLNRFLHPNEPPQRIFWYLVRKLEAELSKIGHNFTKSVCLNMNKIEKDFTKACSPNLIF